MKKQVEILKDFHQFKKGEKRAFEANTSRALIIGGWAKEIVKRTTAKK